MAKRRKTTKDTRMGLYAASHYLNSSVEKELGTRLFAEPEFDPVPVSLPPARPHAAKEASGAATSGRSIGGRSKAQAGKTASKTPAK